MYYRKLMMYKIYLVLFLCILPVELLAEGISDISNYQEKIATDEKIAPYSTQEIINLIKNSLNEKGIYKGSWVDGFNDKRIIAFDKDNFGECEYFYIRFNGKTGGAAIDNLLRFSFPENEASKLESSKRFTANMDKIENADPSEMRSHGCLNWDEKVDRLKSIANEILAASPQIIEENHKAVEATNNEKIRLAEEEEKQQEEISQKAALLEIERKNKLAEEEKVRIENVKKEQEKFYLYAALMLITGGFIWHKFIRRRCPECNAVSPDLIEENELESWLGTKNISEKTTAGKTITRTLNTTYSKIESTYKCAKCSHVWTVISKREK